MYMCVMCACVCVLCSNEMSGVWKRVTTTNFDAFAGAQGAGFLQRKLAGNMSLTHTISVSKSYDQVNIIERGAGPIDFNNTFAIGAKAVKNQMMKRTFLDRMYWEGEALVLNR